MPNYTSNTNGGSLCPSWPRLKSELLMRADHSLPSPILPVQECMDPVEMPRSYTKQPKGGSILFPDALPRLRGLADHLLAPSRSWPSGPCGRGRMITAINATNRRSPGTQNVGPGRVAWLERKRASTDHQQRFGKGKQAPEDRADIKKEREKD